MSYNYSNQKMIQSQVQQYKIPNDMNRPNPLSQKINRLRQQRGEQKKKSGFKFKQAHQSTNDSVYQQPSLLYKQKWIKKPIIANKLHLNYPKKHQQIKIHTLISEQQQFKQKVKGFFNRIFKCCLTVQNVDKQYDQCDYCYRKVYNQYNNNHNNNNKQQINQPYLSYRRIKQREKQPINIFYQQINNQNVKSNRYQTFKKY